MYCLNNTQDFPSPGRSKFTAGGNLQKGLSNTKLSWTKEVFGLCLYYVCSFPAGITQTFPIQQTHQRSLHFYQHFSPGLHEQQLSLNFIHNKWSIYPKILPLQLAVPHQPLDCLWRFCYCFPLHLLLTNKATKSWNLLTHPSLATQSKRGKLVTSDGVCFCCLILSHLQASTPG